MRVSHPYKKTSPYWQSIAFRDKCSRGADKRWRGRLRVPPTANPLVRQLFEIMNMEHVLVREAAALSGVNAMTISGWRYNRNPNIKDIEAVLNALEWRLAIVPMLKKENVQ